MKKIVSAILVVMTCALSGCVAETVDSAEIESELSTDASAELSPEARAVSVNEEDVMKGQADLTSCSAPYRAAIVNYYWTTKPLCAQGYKSVSCAIERQYDPNTPCKISACADYVYVCNPDPTIY